MKHTLPVLITCKNEDYRSLIRDMLIKNGFFQVWEASDETESLKLMEKKNEKIFSIVHIDHLSLKHSQKIEQDEHFIILSQPENPNTITNAAKLGAKHFLSFPFSSRVLMEKLDSLI